jgi:hypothetical protein
LAFCARAASGHAAAPPARPINSRRRIPVPRSECRNVAARTRHLEDARAGRRTYISGAPMSGWGSEADLKQRMFEVRYSPGKRTCNQQTGRGLPINSEWSAYVCFGAHSRLKSDIAGGPESATSGLIAAIIGTIRSPRRRVRAASVVRSDRLERSYFGGSALTGYAGDAGAGAAPK